MSWVVGKKNLRDEVLARFPPYYERYIEVFGGAGWVLFHKPPGMDFEVYNDFNGNLSNLYRCVRDKPNKLKYKLRYVLNSREDFDWIASLHKRGLFSRFRDVDRAAKFYQLIRYSYASGLDSFSESTGFVALSIAGILPIQNLKSTFALTLFVCIFDLLIKTCDLFFRKLKSNGKRTYRCSDDNAYHHSNEQIRHLHHLHFKIFGFFLINRSNFHVLVNNTQRLIIASRRGDSAAHFLGFIRHTISFQCS